MRPDPCLSPFHSPLLLQHHLLSRYISPIERLKKGNNLFLVALFFPLVHPFLVVVFLFSQTVICPMKNHADYEFKISIAQQTMYDKQGTADDMFRAMKSNPFEKLINLRGNENSFGLSRVRVIKGLSSAVKITTNKWRQGVRITKAALRREALALRSSPHVSMGQFKAKDRAWRNNQLLFTEVKVKSGGYLRRRRIHLPTTIRWIIVLAYTTHIQKN